MRKQIGWLEVIAGILLVPALAPTLALAQEAASDDWNVPPSFTPVISHPRIENGGFYVGAEFLYQKTNNFVGSQQVAKRGFIDTDGSATGKPPGTFFGDGNPALNTNQVSGPGVWQPGWDLFVGWKFDSGVAVEVEWRHLMEAQYSASASLLPPAFKVGFLLQNTFLFSPVSNFPEQFAGVATKIPQGNPGNLYGIWNGASVMQIGNWQRFDVYGINARVPITQTDTYRCYGIFGPRIVWLVDEFRWTTIDYDVVGNSSADTSAMYNNTVSNRMYGGYAGFGNDWYLGSTPIGGLSATLDFAGGLYADLAKTNVAYTRLDNVISESRNRRFFNLVPSVEARVGLTWYPWEAIQVHLGYDIMMFFNTIGSNSPIDFNMSSLDPNFHSIFFRWVQGMTFGVTFIF